LPTAPWIASAIALSKEVITDDVTLRMYPLVVRATYAYSKTIRTSFEFRIEQEISTESLTQCRLKSDAIAYRLRSVFQQSVSHIFIIILE
jgi:hypothetical protein